MDRNVSVPDSTSMQCTVCDRVWWMYLRNCAVIYLRAVFVAVSCDSSIHLFSIPTSSYSGSQVDKLPVHHRACVTDTLANIYALNIAICMCLYERGEGPLKIFAPSLFPVIVMRLMLSCDKTDKQLSGKQTSTCDFSGNYFLCWGLNSFVVLHNEVRTGWAVFQLGVYSVVGLIVFSDSLKLCVTVFEACWSCNQTHNINLFREKPWLLAA